MQQKNKLIPTYMLGTDEQLKWRQKYCFQPRGIGFFELGVTALDDAALNAYNIAKSSYQINPEVFNMDYIAQTVGISKDEVIKRFLRMYDERLIMYVATSNIQAAGFGLYYWFVKLKEGTSDEARNTLSDFFQSNDTICTSYISQGDFDYFNGNHMRVLDNLLTTIIDPLKRRPEVEFVHLCPIRRNIRESHVNTSDNTTEDYRKILWGEGQLEKLSEIQDKVDLIDLKIVKAFNEKRPVEEVFNFDVMADISGLDPKQMKDDISELVDNRKTILPILYLNTNKLNLTNHAFVIRLFQITPSYRKAQIADQLAQIPEFNNVYEFSDAYYDILVSAYNEISDINELKQKLMSIEDIEEIKEADITQQCRRWACRLDDHNGFWEETVMTDDFLQRYPQNHELDAQQRKEEK